MLKIKFLSLLILTLILSSFINVSAQNTNNYQKQIQNAVSYLVKHYNSSLGLVYESEDSGQHWLDMGEFKDRFPYTYSQVYWLYSDNLFTQLALESYRPDISNQIINVSSSYAIQEKGEFLTVAGIPIQEYREVSDTIIANFSNHVILTRNYDGKIIQPSLEYADEALYHALSNYEIGLIIEAQNEVLHVASLWNSTCLVDAGVIPVAFTGNNAPTDSGYCPNNRLGLLLFSAKVVGITLPNEASIEQTLWSMQNPDGGIASLSQQGHKLGSANAETTALALLYQNEALIQRIRSNVIITTSIPELSITQITIVIVIILSTIIINKFEYVV